MSSSSHPEFTFDERLGVYFTIQSSCLSVAAVVILLSYALFRWVKRRGSASVSDASGSSLFINLMVADLLQAIGTLPSIRWMQDGHITEGPLCTAQAVLKQIGINNVALSSLCIAAHTFIVLCLRWRVPRHAPKFTVLFIWVFVGIVVGIPNAVHRKQVYYGDTGYWCWILPEFKAAQIMSEYVWVWSSGGIMAILYGMMALVMRGYIIMGDGRGIRWVGRRSRVRPDLTAGDEEERAAQNMANLLLFYPAVYIFCFFFNSLSRWLYFSGHTIPYQFTLFSSAIFQFSGLFNVILYFYTRRDYAVGSASVPVVVTTLPPDNKLPPSPAGSAYKEEELELEHTRYANFHRGDGMARNPSYQNQSEISANTGGGPPSRLFQDSVLQQSPHARTLTMGTVTSTGHGHLSPYADVHPAQANRGNALGHSSSSRLDEDNDDDDYGRLPG